MENQKEAEVVQKRNGPGRNKPRIITPADGNICDMPKDDYVMTFENLLMQHAASTRKPIHQQEILARNLARIFKETIIKSVMGHHNACIAKTTNLEGICEECRAKVLASFDESTGE